MIMLQKDGETPEQNERSRSLTGFAPGLRYPPWATETMIFPADLSDISSFNRENPPTGPSLLAMNRPGFPLVWSRFGHGQLYLGKFYS